MLANGQALSTSPSLAVNNTHVYWLNGGIFPSTVNRIDKNAPGAAVQNVVANQSLGAGLALSDTQIFWSAEGGDEIWRAPLNGGAAALFAAPIDVLSTIVITGGFAHWAGQGYFRVPLSGVVDTSPAPLVVQTGDRNVQFAASGTCLYYRASPSAGALPTQIRRLCTGTVDQLIHNGLGTVNAMMADASGLYFVEIGRGLLWTPPGTASSTLVVPTTDTFGVRDIELDATSIYFIAGQAVPLNCGTSWGIYRISKGVPGAMETMVPPPTACATSLAVDDRAIYWGTSQGQIVKLAK